MSAVHFVRKSHPLRLSVNAVTKRGLPHMKKQKSGVILITGSTAAFKPRPGGQCYAASKGAVTVMGQSLAVELAPFGIRVVVIARQPDVQRAAAFAGLSGDSAGKHQKTKVFRIFGALASRLLFIFAVT